MRPTPVPRAFTKARITELHIDRISDPSCRTQEQHDRCDLFQLRARTADGLDEYICEVTGKHNIPALEEAKRSFLDSIGE